MIDEGLTGWEITEQVSRHTASLIRATEATLGFLSAITALSPQVGSPFAMKYGGVEIASSGKNFAAATGTLAAIADNVAVSAGILGAKQRREHDWKQQLKLSEQEYKQSNLQLLAAEIRLQIAERELEIHEKNIEQADELFDFYKNKFTNLGLYDYMASTLNRLYRDAYNVAFDLALLAEKACQFERFDTEFTIQNDNWQFDKAGLLAGERLMHQLQMLEKKYIENNFRTPEITQTFSLALLDPSQILELRQKGACKIEIPEIVFQMLYPGQFMQIIKSVRISIPCVAGPYTNISAKLTLKNSKVRRIDKSQDARNENDQLEVLEVAKDTSITTSSANNDAGVFELNFRDERYLPFEGAGAISEWRLELPSQIRSFNYDTISDVLLHISYMALDGDRTAAENELAETVKNHARDNGLFRLISLKNEFPNAFNKLLSLENQTTDFVLSNSHFPYPLSDSKLTITKTFIYLKPKKGMAIGNPSPMKINGAISVSWDILNDIPFEGSNNDIIKGGTIQLTGSPLKTWMIDAGNQGIDKDKIEDLLILIEYRIQ